MSLFQELIAIIGAGLSGLTLAPLLELADIDYTVFERDDSATLSNERSSSDTLDIHKELGQVALKEAGLLKSSSPSPAMMCRSRLLMRKALFKQTFLAIVMLIN